MTDALQGLRGGPMAVAVAGDRALAACEALAALHGRHEQASVEDPAWQAPERMRAGRGDARADVWAVGAALYTAIEGAPPFRADDPRELRLAIATEPPVPMSRPVPDAVQAAVLRCLDKPVERRFQTVAELAFALMPFASAPGEARAIVERCAVALGRPSRG